MLRNPLSKVVIVLTCLLGVSSVWAINGHLAGSGTADHPYLIQDFNDFQVFSSDPNYWALGVVTCLTSDIDLDPNLPGRQVYTDAVMGHYHQNNARNSGSISPNNMSNQPPFDGILDGQGYSIKHMTIESDSDSLGLFGTLYGAHIMNLALEDCSISGNGTQVGGLCGNISDLGVKIGRIDHCSVSGSIAGASQVGGLCGDNAASIENCMVTAAVHGTDQTGGICGVNGNYGVVRFSYACGPVTGDEMGNGICGEPYGSVYGCLWDVNTTGVSDADSLLGANGKTTAEMHDPNTYRHLGWFVTSPGKVGSGDWVMSKGEYPRLMGVGSVPEGMTRAPDLTGLDVTQAQAALTQADLVPGKVTEVPSMTVASGMIASASVCAGGWVQQGTAVDLYVSQGPSGDGSAANPWPVASVTDLNAVNQNLGACYYMTNDITLPWGQTFEQSPIAPAKDDYFTGVFDGNGCRVVNLVIKTAHSDLSIGLFGQLNAGAEIRNLALDDYQVWGSPSSGGLCGTLASGTIEECRVQGTVVYDGTNIGNGVGGLCGTSQEGQLLDCTAHTIVLGNSIGVGGLCGWNQDGRIIEATVDTWVTGVSTVGGLCGWSVGYISQSHTTGRVNGVPSNKWGSLLKPDILGCICGDGCGTIIDSYSTAEVVAEDGIYVGGLWGRYDTMWSIETNYSDLILRCYATGDVTSDYFNVGGLCGSVAGGVISQCYATGRVSGEGDYDLAGLCGHLDGTEMENCFWDVNSTGQSVGVIDPNSENTGEVTGETTAQMHTLQTYLDAGWDFVGETANGTSDSWIFVDGNAPQLAAFDPNFSPHVFAGSGTVDDPYLLYNTNDLGAMWQQPDANSALAGDIDLSGITWSCPLVQIFSGSLDGRGDSLSHITLQGGHTLGLFGTLTGQVSNLTLDSVTITGTDYVGGLCGYLSGSVTNVHSSGTVTGNQYVGGICGYAKGTLSNCTSDCATSGNQDVGQVCGYQFSDRTGRR